MTLICACIERGGNALLAAPKPTSAGRILVGTSSPCALYCALTIVRSVTLAMFIGRFLMIVPMVAIAGSLAAKKIVPASAGTFPTDGPLFVGLLVGVILIVGGLTFFPALALGPIVEHLAMNVNTLF